MRNFGKSIDGSIFYLHFKIEPKLTAKKRKPNFNSFSVIYGLS